MADNDDVTDTIRSITEALVKVEELHPNSAAVDRLHRRLWRGLKAHGHLLGLTEEECGSIVAAGGGTPKLPPPPSG